MNKGNYFTCIGKGHGAPCLPASREDWEKLRREPWLAEMCARIENGDEQLKHRLPVWTPHCAEFKGNHRAAADALKPLKRLMLDFDEKGHTEEIAARLQEKNPLEVLLIEDSVRRGTHVLVELPDGMTAEEAQKLMAEATGFTPDAAVKDVSRCIYMVTEKHTKYVSEKLFDMPKVKEALFACQAQTGKEEKPKPLPLNPQLKFRNIPYCEIVKEWWNRNGGEPAEGERNVKLHKLAVNLRSICDNKKEVLMQIMPRLGLTDAELQSIVDSACKETPKGISKMMQSIIDGEEWRTKNEESDTEAVVNETSFKVNTRSLPIGLKESLVGVPVSMRMPVLCAVLPLAAAYADGVSVRYCDGEMQKLGMMSIIYGEQASGKSVCKHAVNIWKRQFDEEDAIARKREDEWKERKKSRKANEKAPEDPKALIRVVPVTVSCSTLLRRLKNACGHTLYSFGEELDTLRKTNGAGSWSSKYDIYRLAFDPLDSEWGQDYNSDQAESGVVKVAYNWTVLGTNGAVRKCFKGDNIENGLSSRILLAEMPDTAFAQMPRYGHRTAEDEAKIQKAVTKLRSFSGFLDTPRLRKAIDGWVEQKRVEAAKDIDHVKDTYRRRAAVIGFRSGVIHYLLSGQEKETSASIEFALMMAEYCLNQQIKVFGKILQSQYVEASEECQRYGVNNSIFDQLPPTFTANDLAALKPSSVPRNSIIKILSRWNRDGWIEKVDTKCWTKIVTSDKVTS